MKFGLILAGVTVGTLILIFGVYRIFLYQPSSKIPSPTPIMQTQIQPQAEESLPVTSSVPVASVTPLPSPAKGQKATAIPIKTTIGTLSVLNDGTGVSSTSGGSAISGSISLVGTPPSGTSIVIVAKVSNSTDSFKTVVSGISATSGSTWSWNGAVSGTSYDMIAILKGSSNGVDTDYAASQTYVITAPSLNQIFSLNAASAPGAPNSSPTITCGAKAANNTWSANINFPTVAGAAYYKMQLGSTSGAYDISNTAAPAQSGDNQVVNVTLNDSVVYYAQYSVANTLNPTAAQYSSFSSPASLKCP